MQLAIRILDDPGRAQDDLVERRAVAERQILDVLPAESVDAAAGVRRQAIARGVEPLPRRPDLDALQLLRCAADAALAALADAEALAAAEGAESPEAAWAAGMETSSAAASAAPANGTVDMEIL